MIIETKNDLILYLLLNHYQTLKKSCNDSQKKEYHFCLEIYLETFLVIFFLQIQKIIIQLACKALFNTRDYNTCCARTYELPTC
jgi:hypothetical protein